MKSQNWHPSANTEMLEKRSQLNQQIRQFFAQRKVLEVETPILSHAANSDPGMEQFQTTGDGLYLRTSSEYPMKRLLAAGSGDIFELGKVFRRGESGRLHHPEFTMLEWYRVGWNYHQLMDEVSALVRHCMDMQSLHESRLRYGDMFYSCTGLDPHTQDDESLLQYAASLGVEVEGLEPQAACDLVFSHFVQPRFPAHGLTFIYDYPQRQAALARITGDDPPVAQRFELFLGRVELANGYQELTQAKEQRCRFERENEARVERGLDALPLDELLLAALESGMPECAGVALGIDRLLMACSGENQLSSTLSFGKDHS